MHQPITSSADAAPAAAAAAIFASGRDSPGEAGTRKGGTNPRTTRRSRTLKVKGAKGRSAGCLGRPAASGPWRQRPGAGRVGAP